MIAETYTTSIQVKVPFHDCDPLFVVWHGHYFKYLELARSQLFSELDLDIPQIRQLGFRMYITDTRCRYMYPLSYGELAEVRAFVTETKPLIRVAYDIRNLSKGRRSARAYSVLATTDTLGQLLPETPHVIVQKLQG